MLTLDNLKRAIGSKKKRKRIGRGNSSGHGTYSTRGMKGQRSRTGGRKGLQKKGFKTTLQRLPKHKGFQGFIKTIDIINLRDLDRKFQDNEYCRIKNYLAKGLMNSSQNWVKILGTGKLSKKLKVTAHYFSKSAKVAIIKAGGEAITIKK